MKILERKQDCCGCHACYNACPVQAIHMEYDDEGFLYPVVTKEMCTNCGKCKAVCPILNAPIKGALENAWACHAIDQEERLTSSSGGVFAVLAREILRSGGLVCGAIWEDDLSVSHTTIENETDLLKLKGAKYVQSAVGDSYSAVKKHLNSGKLVLFSGTPCQVAGLKAFLGKEYDDLLTVDLICHGVPSPALWQDYLTLRGTPSQVDMRWKDPETGQEWMVLRYADGTEVREKKSENPYFQGFLQNLYLRPSCFHCRFKGPTRCSDFTIGDFWSAREYHPEIFDGFGTSAVLVHSEKGRKWLEKISSKLKLESATAKEISTWNTCLLEPVKPTNKRHAFYARWRSEPLLSLLEDLTRQSMPENQRNSLLRRLMNKLRHIMTKE